MKHSLPCLTVLAMLAAVTAVVADSPAVAPLSRLPATRSQRSASADASPVGDRLVLQALTQLQRHQSVTAHLKYHACLDGQQRDGNGDYWQQNAAASTRVRLELRMQIDDSTASLLQVSGSRFLWTDQRLASGRRVARVDLRKLRADPELALADPADVIQPGQASWSAVEPASATMSGGLPSLLSSLVENFTFAPPQAMQLDIGTARTKLPVWAVVGRWRPEKLAQLVSIPADKPEAAALASLPNRLPHEVLLMVGQADLFPCFIEYRRLDEQALSAPPDTPYRLSPRPMVVMVLSNVAYNVPIAASQFDYAPGEADWVDRTAEVRAQLRQRQVATRPATIGGLVPR